MLNDNKPIQSLYGDKGEFLGLFISPEMWDRIEKEVAPVLKRELNKLEREQDPAAQEPLDDWENLKKFWGFNYPVDYDVQCEICGASTNNWQEDDPRRFLLKAANLSGLVTFQCRECGAKIIKKHFKDRIIVETSAPSAS
ncbi:MAG: hypothetical protein K9J48_03335, partial [Desulfohalobiaceae bacterium]|nr:hypothetical protein [Desulfohalobiaceae bacterium]